MGSSWMVQLGGSFLWLPLFLNPLSRQRPVIPGKKLPSYMLIEYLLWTGQFASKVESREHGSCVQGIPNL